MRTVIKVAEKVIMIPVWFAVKLIKIFGTVVFRCSSWIFYLTGAVMLLTGVCCYLFGIEDSGTVLKMLLQGVVVFSLPNVSVLIITALECLDGTIKQCVRL